MKNRMKIEFDNKPENEAFARTATAAFVAVLNPTIEELTEIKTAVSEAVSNAVIYAYPEGDGPIFLECEIDSDERRLVVTVSDLGVGIADVDEARMPMFTGGDAGERSGMGFAIMESFMDKVEVISEVGKGTTVKMMKKPDAGYEF